MKRIFAILLCCIVYQGFSQRDTSLVTLKLEYDSIVQKWDTIGLSKTVFHYKEGNQEITNKISLDNWSFTKNNTFEHSLKSEIYVETDLDVSGLFISEIDEDDFKLDSLIWFTLNQENELSPVIKYKYEYNSNDQLTNMKLYFDLYYYVNNINLNNIKLFRYSEVTYDHDTMITINEPGYPSDTIYETQNSVNIYTAIQDSTVTVFDKDKKILSETKFVFEDSSSISKEQIFYEYDSQGNLLSKSLFKISDDDQLYENDGTDYFYENNRLSKETTFFLLDKDTIYSTSMEYEYTDSGNFAVEREYTNDVLKQIDSTFYDQNSKPKYKDIYSTYFGGTYKREIYFNEYDFNESSSIPTKPEDLRVTEFQSNDSSGKGGFVNLEWNDLATNEERYEIYRKDERGIFFLYETLVANTNFFVDSSVVDSIEYFYIVVVVNEMTDGNEIKILSDTVQASTSMKLLGQEEENDLVLHVYPNPATDVIFIDNVNIDVVSLIDMNGKVVLEGNENSLDVYDLNPGIYILQVIDDNGRMYKQLITKE